jgi:hypothetical protein
MTPYWKEGQSESCVFTGYVRAADDLQASDGEGYRGPPDDHKSQ